MKPFLLIATSCFFGSALGAAELGPRPPQSDTVGRNEKPASIYTPQNGYFADLTLIGRPASLLPDDETHRVLVRLLELVSDERKLRARLAALDQSKETFGAESEALRQQQEELRKAITRLLTPSAEAER